MAPLILTFADPGATLALVGGKGQNLITLARAKFPVPPGFVLTTEAYRAFVNANQIQDRLLAFVNSLDPNDPIALDSASAEIGTLFANGQIPPDIVQSITITYNALAATPNLPVAVRSSATAEDLPGLSFAGQQDTYLNIVGPQAVLDAVKKCWASLWTARAIGYRARNHIPPDQVTLAVVVQQLIASESSGVLFTANPLTGRRDEMVIDASFGLGEAIVSGVVEPDHYAVDSKTWTITTRILGAKALAILPSAQGGTHQRQGDQSTLQALPDEQILTLCKLAGQVAAHFGNPQDIEWAWANGQLYLLQSRPITSLFPVPQTPVPSDAIGFYFSFASIQGVTEPLTPLGRDILRDMLAGVVHRVFRINVPAQSAIPDAGERLYLNFTEVARHPQMREVLLLALDRADPAARQVLAKLIQEDRLPLKRTGPNHLPAFMAHVMPRIVPGAIAALIAPQRSLAHSRGQAQAFLSEVAQQLNHAHSLAERVAFIEKYSEQGFENLFLPLVPGVAPAIVLLSPLDNWLVAWAGAQPGAALTLMRGLPGNVTSEMNLKLWDTVQTIRADPSAAATLSTQPIPQLIAQYHQGTLPAVAQSAVKQFLDEYGMRAVTEIDVARPRWRDDPSSVFQTLQSYLGITNPATAPDAVFRRGAAEAERLAVGYVAQANRGLLGPFRAAFLKFVINRMRALAGSRESPKFYLIKLLDIFRTLLLDSAGQLVAQARLAQPDDIFFLSLQDLKRAAQDPQLDLKSIVAQNRATYEFEETRRQIPRVLLSTGEAFYQGLTDSAAGPNDLVGQAVSPGLVEGIVRVVLDPRGTRLEPGEILVCVATDPGWTPLFLAAGGLVMEIGGLVTHGSVVAREYGLPAVVGVQSATTRLTTGQRVRVDGTTGRVTILS